MCLGFLYSDLTYSHVNLKSEPSDSNLDEDVKLNDYLNQECFKHISTDPLIISKRKRPVCKVCQKTYFNNSDLKRHIESVHERKERYKCSNCGKGFWAKFGLKKHFLSVHEGIPHRKQNALCQNRFYLQST